MALLEVVESLLPYWMVTAPRRHYAALMSGFAGMLDAMTEMVVEARLASLPGQVDLAGVPGTGGFDGGQEALDLTGRDRSIRQGLTEDIFSYAAAQRQWLDEWRRSGTVPELLDELARILGPNPPMLRLVEGDGTWWTRHAVPDLPSGVIHAGTIVQLTQGGNGFQYDPVTGALVSTSPTVPVAWDWDSLANPPLPAGEPPVAWLIIYEPYDPYLNDTDRTFLDPGTCGDYAATPGTSGAGIGPNAGTIGTNAPRRLVDLVRNLLNEWRSSGAKVDIIISFDPAAFSPVPPDSTPTSITDGKQAWHTWFDAGANTRLPHRFPNAEYWSGHYPVAME